MFIWENDRPVWRNAHFDKENFHFNRRNFDFDKESDHLNRENCYFVLRNSRFDKENFHFDRENEHIKTRNDHLITGQTQPNWSEKLLNSNVGQTNTNQHLQPLCKGTQSQRYKPTFANRLQVQNINSRNIIGQTSHRVETQQLTLGFAIVGLDGISLNICSLLYFSSSLTL